MFDTMYIHHIYISYNYKGSRSMYRNADRYMTSDIHIIYFIDCKYYNEISKDLI